MVHRESSPLEERRYAPDNEPYTLAEFLDYYGQEEGSLCWNDALEQGLVYNLVDGAAKLGCSTDVLGKKYDKLKKGVDLLKFGGGFYCAKLEKDGKGPFYVFNGFFMTMRAGYVKPGASIYYYVVEWESAKLPWADFRGKILGPTDPADAPSDSLRGRAGGGEEGRRVVTS